MLFVQINLLDFGACRSFSDEFVDEYLRLVHAAITENKEQILKSSQKLGFLTGEEDSVMNNVRYVLSLFLLSWCCEWWMRVLSLLCWWKGSCWSGVSTRSSFSIQRSAFWLCSSRGNNISLYILSLIIICYYCHQYCYIIIHSRHTH